MPKPTEQAATGAGATVSINAEEPWRTKQPVAAAARSRACVPVPQSFELSNGLTVIALPQTGGVPVVSANLVLRSGSDTNPLEKPGLASFTADVLDRGTATRNALQLAEEVAQIGASLDTNITRCDHGVDEQPQQEFCCGACPSPTSRFARVFLLRKSNAFARPASRVSLSNGESSSDRRQRHGQDAVWHASIRIQRAGAPSSRTSR